MMSFTEPEIHNKLLFLLHHIFYIFTNKIMCVIQFFYLFQIDSRQNILTSIFRVDIHKLLSLSHSCVSTIVWLHHLNFNKAPGEKAR